MSCVIDDLNSMVECFNTGVWPTFAQNIVMTEIAERVRKSANLDGILKRGMLNQPVIA